MWRIAPGRICHIAGRRRLGSLGVALFPVTKPVHPLDQQRDGKPEHPPVGGGEKDRYRQPEAEQEAIGLPGVSVTTGAGMSGSWRREIIWRNIMSSRAEASACSSA